MRGIRARNTTPELCVRKGLFASGFRYRLHAKNLPGKPDIVLNKYNSLIFVNGCFWHGHKGCKFFRMPKSNLEYWKPKIAKNIENDKKHQKELKALGWKVVVVWECELKKNDAEKTLSKLVKQVIKNLPKSS